MKGYLYILTVVVVFTAFIVVSICQKYQIVHYKNKCNLLYVI